MVENGASRGASRGASCLFKLKLFKFNFKFNIIIKHSFSTQNSCEVYSHSPTTTQQPHNQSPIL